MPVQDYTIGSGGATLPHLHLMDFDQSSSDHAPVHVHQESPVETKARNFSMTLARQRKVAHCLLVQSNVVIVPQVQVVTSLVVLVTQKQKKTESLQGVLLSFKANIAIYERFQDHIFSKKKSKSARPTLLSEAIDVPESVSVSELVSEKSQTSTWYSAITSTVL